VTWAAKGLKWGLGRALVVFVALTPVLWLLSFVVAGPLSLADRFNLAVAASLLEYGTLLVMKRFGLKEFVTPPQLSDSFNDESKLVGILSWLNSHKRVKSLLSPLLFLVAVAPAGVTFVVLALRFPLAIRLIQTLGMPPACCRPAWVSHADTAGFGRHWYLSVVTQDEASDSSGRKIGRYILNGAPDSVGSAR
jgi:hypothetical protein